MSGTEIAMAERWIASYEEWLDTVVGDVPGYLVEGASLARALLVRDRQLRELREAADEFANRDGSPAAQDRLIAALAASDPDSERGEA